MTRYVKAVRPRASWGDEAPLLPPIQVGDAEPKDTGLLDADGQRIYSIPDQVGFVASRIFTER